MILCELIILLNTKNNFMLLFMLGLGIMEVIILTSVLVLFFGSKKIPKLARSIRENIKILKHGFLGEIDKKNKIDKKD